MLRVLEFTASQYSENYLVVEISPYSEVYTETNTHVWVHKNYQFKKLNNESS